MIEYRHLTNLQQPFDHVDQRFLDTIADYRVGQPTIDQMIANKRRKRLHAD